MLCLDWLWPCSLRQMRMVFNPVRGASSDVVDVQARHMPCIESAACCLVVYHQQGLTARANLWD